MDIFLKIEEIAKEGYFIDYMIHDAIEEGHRYMVEDGEIPLITYTVNVIRNSDCAYIYSESFDHLEECLNAGIKFMEDFIR